MLIGIDASRADVAHPTGTEIYSVRLIQTLLALESRHRFRLYFRSTHNEHAFPGAELRFIPFPRIWTHLRLAWEMAQDPPDVLLVPAHVLPVVHPARSLVTIHDLGYLHFPRAHSRLAHLYLDVSTRWNIRAASHILADSEATKTDLVDLYRAPPDKITVAYPGYDETLSPIEDPQTVQSALSRYGITGDYFLFLGTLQPRKNLSRLVSAFAQLPNPSPGRKEPKLVLAGQPGWKADRLRAQVHRMGLEGRVLFPGYISSADKAALLSGALALVFPSLNEGFGLPVLEAQACGCPVITSNTSSLPEAAGDAAILVNPTDTAAITDAMLRVAASADCRDALVQRGLKHVLQFSWTRCGQSVMDAIARCSIVVPP